ncbi:MAG TPA: hypothetical protein DIW47_12780 [Bacteroidetes bacterium]|nr:hypothetical protein [Bacteroidota bacterium]
MIRFRQLFLIGVLGISTASFAGLGGGFSVGYRFGIPKWNSFDQFKSGYQSYYQNSIQDDFSGFSVGRGLAINSDMTFGGFVMGLRYSQYRFDDQVSFKSGGSRHFEGHQNLLAIAMGFGYQGEKGHAQFTMALLGGSDRVDSYYAYTDGTRSYAGERPLNGKYEALRMGWSARAEFSVLFFYAGVEYVFGKMEGIGLPLDDGFTGSNGLATDYGSWVADPIAYGTDKFVTPDLNGLRFELGLRLNLADK